MVRRCILLLVDRVCVNGDAFAGVGVDVTVGAGVQSTSAETDAADAAELTIDVSISNRRITGSTVGPIRFSSRDKGFCIVKIKVGVV